jgi:NAD(P)H-nitrite reductase large subunit
MNHLIIGGGPAGITAAAWLRRLNRASNVTVLSKEDVSPYAKMALPYRLSGETDEEHILLPVPQGVKVLLGRNVARVEPDRHRVTTAAGEAFTYDRLLIAAGGVPERPRVEGSDLPFVFTVRDLPDLRLRDHLHRRCGRAVIAGAGPVSMETGDALHKLGMKITYVVSSGRIFSSMLDRPAAELVRQRLEELGIEILTGDEITRISEDGEVSLRSGEKRASDVVIFGKGVKPCLDFLAGSGIAVKKGIAVNAFQKTNVPDIFAAGDAAEAMDIVYGEPRVNALWPVAVEQGRTAALNMFGIQAAYRGSVVRNILRVFGVSIFTAGRSRDEGPGVYREQDDRSYRKIVLARGALEGLVFVGEVRNEGLYVNLITQKVEVSSQVNRLLKGSYNWSHFFSRSVRREESTR